MEQNDLKKNLDMLEIAEKTFRVLLDGRRGGMRFDDTMDFFSRRMGSNRRAPEDNSC